MPLTRGGGGGGVGNEERQLSKHIFEVCLNMFIGFLGLLGIPLAYLELRGFLGVPCRDWMEVQFWCISVEFPGWPGDPEFPG